jgi:hypothetical protein
MLFHGFASTMNQHARIAMTDPQHLGHFGQSVPQAAQVNGRSLPQRQLLQGGFDPLSKFVADGSVNGVGNARIGEIRSCEVGSIEAQQGAFATSTIDARIGDRAKENLDAIARQIIAIGMTQDANVAILNDILSRNGIAQQSPCVGQCTR